MEEVNRYRFFCAMIDIDNALDLYSSNNDIESVLQLAKDPYCWEIMLKKLDITEAELIFAIKNKASQEQIYPILYPYRPIMLHCKQSKGFHRLELVHVIYANTGRIVCENEESTFVLEEGMACIFGPGVKHAFRTENEKGIAVNFLMTSQALTDMLSPKGMRANTLSASITNMVLEQTKATGCLCIRLNNPKLCNFFVHAAMYETVERKLANEETVNSYCSLFFTELLRSYTSSDWDVISNTGMENTHISEIISFVSENAATVTLKDCANHFHFNPNYLGTLIKKHTNRTFTDLIHQFRMEKASMLLKYTDEPIQSVAVSAGYNNITYFYKLFGNYYNMQPSEYRRKNRIVTIADKFSGI